MSERLSRIWIVTGTVGVVQAHTTLEGASRAADTLPRMDPYKYRVESTVLYGDLWDLDVEQERLDAMGRDMGEKSE